MTAEIDKTVKAVFDPENEISIFFKVSRLKFIECFIWLRKARSRLLSPLCNFLLMLNKSLAPVFRISSLIKTPSEIHNEQVHSLGIAFRRSGN